MESYAKTATDTPILDAVERQSRSYVQSGWDHFKVEGRGALFAMPWPDGGIETVFMPYGEIRLYFRQKGRGWLRWFKEEVRPKVRSYDPKVEVVVLTCPDGPYSRIVGCAKHV